MSIFTTKTFSNFGTKNCSDTEYKDEKHWQSMILMKNLLHRLLNTSLLKKKESCRVTNEWMLIPPKYFEVAIILKIPNNILLPSINKCHANDLLTKVAQGEEELLHIIQSCVRKPNGAPPSLTDRPSAMIM